MRIARCGLAATIALLCLSLAVPGWTAPITYLSPDNINQIPVSAANPLPVTGGGGGGGSNAAASATGSAVPSSASYTGLNFGGNLKGWTGDTNGYGDVNVMNVPGINITQIGGTNVTAGAGFPVDIVAGTITATFTGALPAGTNVIGYTGGDGTAGTASTHVETVQGISGGTAVPVSLASIPAAANPNQATASVPINVSTATTTQLVALSSGKVIYVSAWDVEVAGADNITLEYGTGTACATGTTVLTGAYNFAANGGISKGSGIAPVLFVPASNALCIVTSAAVQASGSVAYAQF